MGKDPALLFYTKDWLTDTMEMSAQERGVYINLLAYQHINGSLPNNPEKLLKIALVSSEENFSVIWKGIKHKFHEVDNRLLNQRVSETVSERSSKALKNKIVGIFGALIRVKHLPDDTVLTLKKAFKVEDFLNIPSERLSETIGRWLANRLPSLEDEDGNANEDEINNIWIRTWGRTPKLPELEETGVLIKKFGKEKTFKIMKESCLKGFKIFQTLIDALDENGDIKSRESRTEKTELTYNELIQLPGDEQKFYKKNQENKWVKDESN